MKTTFILFKTDAWNTDEGKELFGVFETKELLIDSLKKENWVKLTTNNENNLKDLNQTQGREVNFLIEKVEINTIIG